jgi:signal transduction histidine kinase
LFNANMTRTSQARKDPAGWLFKAWPGLAVFVWLTTAPGAPAQETNRVLTNASDVLSLSPRQAGKHIPLLVRGIVTAAEPQWNGQFFVQDSTGGIFVENLSQRQPEPGDLVEISGVSHAGAFAPIIGQPTWNKLGTGPLPEAKMVPIEQLMSGSEDSQRVEISGIVRAAQIASNKSDLALEIASAGYRFAAFPKAPPGMDPQRLVGATVRLKGTAAASLNPVLRRLVAVNLFMPASADFVVETTDAINPFDRPTLTLNSIARYRRDKRPGERVHVKGVITYLRPGKELFIQDKTGGLRVESSQVGSVAVGDVIEAAGFADFENFLPVLQDAVFRKTSEPETSLTPKSVTMREVQDGLCHADLVRLPGKLMDSFVRRDLQQATGKMRTRTVLLMQSENLTYTAETEAPEAAAVLSAIPVGSTIEVSGVCFTESGGDGKSRSFQILMPTGKEVRILQKPSWLTPQRLLASLGVLLAVSIAAVGWTVMVSKKNAALKILILEKEKARLELREAHDLLDERVKERTAQLKLQITARKELEVQSKATLAERTRLAQELHDTLEQALTGVALQLDTTARLFKKEPQSANQHLELARNLVTESQTEVHRSVWNLRCRALEQFDLPGAVMMSSRQITGGSSLRVEMKAQGRVRPLPEIVEENLLRIAQEALTNVIKHSGATLTEIELDYGPKNVVLQVKDNGKGFALDHCAGPREGHFGLLGISERAKRLHGEILFSSAPEAGTTVRVQIPIPHESYAPELAEPQLSS